MTAKTHSFKTEMTQLMDIIIHSLYSNPDIFLRELISNASDAIDKARFHSITDSSILEDDSDWTIRLIPDNDSKTLTIRDNGIGMDEARIVEDLGTIARSGTREFIQKLQEAKAEDRPELIGQFGLGFYASFMVAEKVTVLSRMAGKPEDGVRWESDGKGSYSVETAEKATRGTDIIVTLKDDFKDYLNEWKLRQLVRSFSDFIEHPIKMEVEEKDKDDKPVTKDETLNSRQAVWQKPKSQVKDEDYKSFYKHISRDFQDPLTWIHYYAEGAFEFKSLLYIPSHQPMDWLYPERKSGLNLYIKRVFIMDDCQDLLPPYLRFVQGVVDASDLPLNVSREILQQNAQVGKIKTNLVSKILGKLASLQKDKPEDYKTFYDAFGAVLKEGLSHDYANREKLADLLMYETAAGEPGLRISLKDYVEKMPDDQKEIYYIVGEKRSMLARSPYLESVRAKGYDVLLMTDPVDEWVAQSLPNYQEKPLKAVDKGDLEDDVDEETKKQHEESYKDLMSYLKDNIEEIKDVRLSSRLKDSASCLVTEDGQMGAYMENLMKRLGHGDDLGESPRILELNPEHTVVKGLLDTFAKDKDDARLKDLGYLLYDQAVLAEGSKIKDPQAFAQRLNTLMARDLG